MDECDREMAPGEVIALKGKLHRMVSGPGMGVRSKSAPQLGLRSGSRPGSSMASLAGSRPMSPVSRQTSAGISVRTPSPDYAPRAPALSQAFDPAAAAACDTSPVQPVSCSNRPRELKLAESLQQPEIAHIIVSPVPCWMVRLLDLQDTGRAVMYAMSSAAGSSASASATTGEQEHAGASQGPAEEDAEGPADEMNVGTLACRNGVCPGACRFSCMENGCSYGSACEGCHRHARKRLNKKRRNKRRDSLLTSDSCSPD